MSRLFLDFSILSLSDPILAIASDMATASKDSSLFVDIAGVFSSSSVLGRTDEFRICFLFHGIIDHSI